MTRQAFRAKLSRSNADLWISPPVRSVVPTLWSQPFDLSPGCTVRDVENYRKAFFNGQKNVEVGYCSNTDLFPRPPRHFFSRCYA